jgi:hypothetical protein
MRVVLSLNNMPHKQADDMSYNLIKRDIKEFYDKRVSGLEHSEFMLTIRVFRISTRYM